jgi:hypothetical protein
MGVTRTASDELKELGSIKKLLILLCLKMGATYEDVDKATDMGASNLRAMFPGVRKKGE